MNLDSINEKKRAGMTTNGISLSNFPSQPGRKSRGTKATMLVRMAKVTGMATRWVPSMEAASAFFPRLPCV